MTALLQCTDFDLDFAMSKFYLNPDEFSQSGLAWKIGTMSHSNDCLNCSMPQVLKIKNNSMTLATSMIQDQLEFNRKYIPCHFHICSEIFHSTKNASNFTGSIFRFFFDLICTRILRWQPKIEFLNGPSDENEWDAE